MASRLTTILVVILAVLIAFYGLNSGANKRKLELRSQGEELSTMVLLVEGIQNMWRNRAPLNEFALKLYSNPELPLKDRTFIVTGATKGLGRGIAAHLVALGASVILPYRSAPQNFQEALVEEAKSLRNAYGVDVTIMDIVKPKITMEKMDLADLDSVKKCVENIKSQFEKIDVLINNAGLINHNGDVTAQGYELSFGVNFLGTAHFTKSLIDAGLLKPGKGSKVSRIVSVSSEEHRSGKMLKDVVPFGSHNCSGIGESMELYAYSKLAQTTFFMELGRRFGTDELVVYDICPGPVASDIASNVPLIGPYVTKFLSLIFPSPTSAALPVLRLAIADEFATRTAEHHHMGDLRPAREDARDPAIGKWLWEEVERLISQRRDSKK